jgi:hypothetical protein
MLAKTPNNAISDEDDFCGWLGASLPGDRCCYYQGFLAVDTDPSVSPLGKAERKVLKQLGNRAMLAADLGLVHLIQRRDGPNLFSYFAVVARPRDHERHGLRLRAATGIDSLLQAPAGASK